MILIITGGGDYADVNKVFQTLDALHERTPANHVFMGDATGADALAERWCRANEVDFTVMPAKWSKYGKAAGPHRNAQLIESIEITMDKGTEAPFYAVAFRGGRGTADMVRRCLRAGIEVIYPDRTEESDEDV